MIGFNVTTPAGRAVQHILDNSALSANRAAGWDLVVHHDGGRELISHPAFTAHVSSGEASLILIIESLVEQGPVNLGYVFGTLDADNRRVVAEAMWIAAGYELGVAA